MRRLLERAAAERLTGGRPSLGTAIVASAVAGGAAAALTFRLLRATH